MWLRSLAKDRDDGGTTSRSRKGARVGFVPIVIVPSRNFRRQVALEQGSQRADSERDMPVAHQESRKPAADWARGNQQAALARDNLQEHSERRNRLEDLGQDRCPAE